MAWPRRGGCAATPKRFARANYYGPDLRFHAPRGTERIPTSHDLEPSVVCGGGRPGQGKGRSCDVVIDRHRCNVSGSFRTEGSRDDFIPNERLLGTHR